jgi:5-methylcytosine-specific restriction endonuclease McrA
VPKRTHKNRFRREIIEAWESRCAYCGIQPEKITLDHIIARTNGGETKRSNLIPACAPCNGSKGHSDIWLWYREQSFYSLNRERIIKDWITNKKAPV